MTLEANPRGCKNKVNVRSKAEDDLSSQAYSSCVLNCSGYAKVIGSKQHDTPPL